MAEKVSTLILKVDLDCHWCYKKIRKILCRLQDKERIRTISYDDGNNSIAVVGAFDPHKLSCKIRCMAGKVIRGIEIMHDGGGKPPKMAGPPPMNNGKKKQKERPKEQQPPPPPAEPEQPPAASQPAPPDSHISAVMPAMIEEEKPRERPAEAEYAPMEMLPPPPAPVEKERPRERFPPPAPKPAWPAAEMTITPTVEIPSCPAPPPAAAGHCGCSSCQPCYQGYYEGCRCGSCGRVRFPPPAPKPAWSAAEMTITPTVEIPSCPAPPAAAAGHCGCSSCQPCYQGYYEGCRCGSCGRVYGYAVGLAPTPMAGCYGGGAYRPRCHVYCEEDPAGACTIM